MKIKEQFIRFWRSPNDKVAILRDVFIAFIAVFIVLMGLWAYTGQWFGAPMVAIESGSMEHPNSPFGRLGTIDAGDMVLVQKISKPSDLVPHGGPFGGSEANKGWRSYEDYGDVIIYKPLGDTTVSQIIHRCMCYVTVTVQDEQTYYTIADYGIFNETTFSIPSLGVYNFPDHSRGQQDWTNSGYLTKGDNNNIIDQATSICPEPVKLEWISGRARSEIPWIGTINLFFEDLLHGKDTLKNVHSDSQTCLIIVIVVLISIPISWDVYDYIKERKKRKTKI